MEKKSEHGDMARALWARGVFPHQFSWLIDNPLRRLVPLARDAGQTIAAVGFKPNLGAWPGFWLLQRRSGCPGSEGLPRTAGSIYSLKCLPRRSGSCGRVVITISATRRVTPARISPSLTAISTWPSCRVSSGKCQTKGAAYGRCIASYVPQARWLFMSPFPIPI